MYYVFKISILILRSGDVEKVGFEVGLLQWQVLGFIVKLYWLVSTGTGGDFKYSVLVCLCC